LDRSVTVSARTLDEAKQMAMKQLGVTDEKALGVTVLEETKGLFNRQTIRIHATLDEAVVSVPATPAPPPEVRHEEDRHVEPKGEPVTAGHVHEEVEATETQPSTRDLLAAAHDEEVGRPDVEITAAMIEDAIALLQRIVDSAELKIDVSHQATEGRYIHLAMSGPDVPYIIGKRGAVIDALQYLVNVMFSKTDDTGMPRLVLDGDNYRAKRAETLRTLALELAAQVKSRGEEAELEPLPAHERRIVHRVLRDEGGIKTYSEGSEPDRRVIISPG